MKGLNEIKISSQGSEREQIESTKFGILRGYNIQRFIENSTQETGKTHL